LAENGCAALADDNSLSVAKNSGNGKAAWALDVHEERARSRDEGLEANKLIS